MFQKTLVQIITYMKYCNIVQQVQFNTFQLQFYLNNTHPHFTGLRRVLQCLSETEWNSYTRSLVTDTFFFRKTCRICFRPNALTAKRFNIEIVRVNRFYPMKKHRLCLLFISKQTQRVTFVLIFIGALLYWTEAELWYLKLLSNVENR